MVGAADASLAGGVEAPRVDPEVVRAGDDDLVVGAGEAAALHRAAVVVPVRVELGPLLDRKEDMILCIFQVTGKIERLTYLYWRGDIVEDRRELLPQSKNLCARRVEGGGHGALAAVPAPKKNRVEF